MTTSLHAFDTSERIQDDAPRAIQRAPRSFDPLRILSRAERRRHLAAYTRYVHTRDGELDFENRRLSNREQFFSELAKQPVVFDGPVDQDAFASAFASRARKQLDPMTNWLVVLARSNEGESFGVEQEVEKCVRKGLHLIEPAQLYTLIEEEYHSRLLGEACRTAGLEMPTPCPAALVRGMIYATQYLPDSIRYVLILASEIIACVVFSMLLERLDVFREHPKLQERLRLLVSEVLADETFHVLYCRARVGPIGVRAARAIMRITVAVWGRAIPEVRELGLTPSAVAQRIRQGFPLIGPVEWGEPEPSPGRA